MAEPLKDLIDHDLVEQFIGHIARLDPKADLTSIRAVTSQLDPLELKDRVNLVADDGAGLVVLERLRHDPSEYVRRSVANHLNDMAKTHPATVTDTTRRWMAEPGTDRTMVRHALRSLVKAGDTVALSFWDSRRTPDRDRGVRSSTRECHFG